MPTHQKELMYHPVQVFKGSLSNFSIYIQRMFLIRVASKRIF